MSTWTEETFTNTSDRMKFLLEWGSLSSTTLCAAWNAFMIEECSTETFRVRMYCGILRAKSSFATWVKLYSLLRQIPWPMKILVLFITNLQKWLKLFKVKVSMAFLRTSGHLVSLLLNALTNLYLTNKRLTCNRFGVKLWMKRSLHAPISGLMKSKTSLIDAWNMTQKRDGPLINCWTTKQWETWKR
jgi:hypothetical protein